MFLKKNGVFDWISRYTLITFQIHWPSIFGTTKSMTHSPELMIRDVRETTPINHKLCVIKNCISNGFRFRIKFLWTSPSVSLSIHIYGTVQPVHNDMKPVLGEGVPKWKEVSRKKKRQNKSNQTRIWIFFILCFEKLFWK